MLNISTLDTQAKKLCHSSNTQFATNIFGNILIQSIQIITIIFQKDKWGILETTSCTKKNAIMMFSIHPALFPHTRCSSMESEQKS